MSRSYFSLGSFFKERKQTRNLANNPLHLSKVMGWGMKNSFESTTPSTLASESLYYVTITVLYGFRMHRRETACFGIL